jgi:hypothetical protein
VKKKLCLAITEELPLLLMVFQQEIYKLSWKQLAIKDEISSKHTPNVLSEKYSTFLVTASTTEAMQCQLLRKIIMI